MPIRELGALRRDAVRTVRERAAAGQELAKANADARALRNLADGLSPLPDRESLKNSLAAARERAEDYRRGARAELAEKQARGRKIADEARDLREKAGSIAGKLRETRLAMRDRAALDKARARQEENIGKADEILALLKDEGGKDSGLGETSEISLIKKYETPISKDFVSADEYKDYQSMYDHFDTIDIPQTYKEGLINSYENMDGNLKRTYNEFAAKLNIADSEYDGIARFDSISGDIKLDWKQDIDNPLGFGNTYFHETGHAIDYYKGLSPKGVGLSAQAGFTALAQQDFNGSIARVTRQYAFTNVEAQSIISADLMRNPNASNCVSDVFGGLTGNKVRGVWGHNNKYWSDRGGAASPIIGQEAFAEINADVCVNNADSLSYINKYLPKTKAMYDKIMGGA